MIDFDELREAILEKREIFDGNVIYFWKSSDPNKATKKYNLYCTARADMKGKLFDWIREEI